MENNERSFDDYMEACHKLMKMVFGKELYNEMAKAKLKVIKWDGLDLQMNCDFPKIKERFTKEWVEYHSERDRSALDIFLQSVFNYGSDSYEYREKPTRDALRSIVDVLIKDKPAPIDCRSEEGVTIGIIDSIITQFRVLKDRNIDSANIIEALKDLRSDECLSSIIIEPQPSK